MLASKVIERYQAFCPSSLSMEDDVSGLQIGTLNKDIQKVMVALDIRETTVAEAIDKNIDLIIVKHAPIFRPISHLVADDLQAKIYLDLIKHDIAVYVSHTDIDVVEGGLNDWFCELLDIKDTTYFHETQAGHGIGRIGVVQEQTLEELALKVKQVFDLDAVRLVTYGHQAQQYVERVAICGGTGSRFYKEALEKGADVYITGDIYYHTAQEMLTQGLLAIDPGHHIEVLFVEKVTQKIKEWAAKENWGITIEGSTVSTNPFRHL
ncbi:MULTISPECIES: Nif3-like dinuclear metal center hexameric protein [unclassified Streptococcus]|uniref:Nif3-like dinuclear metal center hexameric protein n=1 Tax=unclassified Streptococcus TaxID=2608887 RepID=UPI0010719980|nr:MULTISPECIES: Nif3-like dinuclear metal center hexameric protein [unclassified Streptococcus]MBF0786578.1 Nif3-like dinuclear metal center hexameric protein [Streptococcus sp. 19428wC2_LYSM12]MCQ9210929.1 Nif3-like dinuclear metal center hexameric protein [Streptococcus sp. B01]MCQ9214198.1 Nif3-like dinuclear metal center hexameric protein [Streptococcus sp. O1]TFV06541.1 Nif3-like dinuclear metal center hexameric protein [Streptococcus sp. LYSM12]